VFVTGVTLSPGWVSGGWDGSLSGVADAFVARISDDIDIGLRLREGASTVRVACKPPVTSSPLRISKNGTTYGIALVEPYATNASKMQIMTPAGIRAWRKLP
jgi:hypothetical protein